MLAVCVRWWHSLLWLMSLCNGECFSSKLHYDEVGHALLTYKGDVPHIELNVHRRDRPIHPNCKGAH